MDELVHAALGFPASLFTAALVVVVAYWGMVAVGASEVDAFDGDADLDGIGMAGVPVSVAVSLLVVFAWFGGVVGSVLLREAGTSGVLHAGLASIVLLSALVLAWGLTRAAVRPLSRLFPDEPGPSRHDFVGRVGTVRTLRVDAAFGQAEVAADDGSTAVVQVRLTHEDASDPANALTAGNSALLYAYDDAGEFFWVAPHAPLDRLSGAHDATA